MCARMSGNWARSLCFSRVEWILMKRTSSAKTIPDTSRSLALYLGPWDYAFLTRLCSTDKHFLWYLASWATISPALIRPSSSVSSIMVASIEIYSPFEMLQLREHHRFQQVVCRRNTGLLGPPLYWMILNEIWWIFTHLVRHWSLLLS